VSVETLTVAELLARAQQAVVTAFPGPVWVRGEVTGYRRTSGGAAFFRLADAEVDEVALDVSGRGRIMSEIERVLGHTGLGGLRDGVEVRVKGTLGVEQRSSVLRLSLLEIDPAFTAGRLAIERAEVIGRMTADGSIAANGSLPIPLVPLRIGLVTSRGSAAHGDFIDQLRRSKYRYAIKTVHTTVQGETAPERVAAALRRFSPDVVDIVALVRGGGSKLDLSVFDSEVVARAVAGVGVPVLTGIGHDIDHTVTDEAAAIAEKTPSAAGEWLVGRVRDFADRIDRARAHIRREGLSALDRHRYLLGRAASDITGGATVLGRQRDHLRRLEGDIARVSRQVLTEQRAQVTSLADWFAAIDLERTLRRGFAIITNEATETVIKSVTQVAPGDEVKVRLADGTVLARVIET